MKERPQPIERKLVTPGVLVLLALIGIGVVVAGYRFLFGLSAVTNLDQQHPWGLWIAIDVATGVALAAGGFTTAALAHVFHRHHYDAIVRPALLTAMLGYTFVGIGLMADLGRYYNIWHPAWPTMWQGNSVLFEVGMCVMCYLTVLYIEFLPIVCERFMTDERRPRLARMCAGVHRLVNKTMFVFILAGVVLSCLHQSSLGTLMVIAPSKMHPLWWTPVLPLLFLLSAVAVGFPMVIFESLIASRSLGRKPEMKILTPLARIVPVTLFIYLAFKIGDLTLRGAWGYVIDGSPESGMFILEVGLGVVVPILLLLRARRRRSPAVLMTAASLTVLGVALNRINVFLVAFRPHYAPEPYFPSFGEVAVTAGLVAGLVFMYRVLVTVFPILPREEES